MALLIEMVVDLSMKSGFETAACAIVEPTSDLLAIGVADLFHRRGIRAKPGQSPSVTTVRGRPYFFMMRLRNFSAAALSRFAVVAHAQTS